MLLAAGYGERLLPLTLTVPKPLLPVLGRPLAPQVLRGLARQGIDEAVINLHHLPAALEAALGDGRELGLRRLHYSLEPDRLLGTGGGLMHASAALRGSGTILVRNADFLADIPLARVLASHRASAKIATLVVVPHRSGYTPVELDRDGGIARFGGRGDGAAALAGSFLFTGFHLIEPAVLDLLPRGRPSDIVKDVYFGLAAEGRLHAFVHDGFWWEFGAPREYLEGSMQLLELPTDARVHLGEFDPVRKIKGSVAAVGAGVDLRACGIAIEGRAVLGFGTRVDRDARIEDSVVMPEAWIGPGARLRRAIIGPGAEIPAGTVVEDAMAATDVRPGAPLPPGTERHDRLLVRGLDGRAR